MPERQSRRRWGAGVTGRWENRVLMRGNPERIEAMARDLFKSWFVDFHPVIDNALRAASPMPHELADRAGARREALRASASRR